MSLVIQEYDGCFNTAVKPAKLEKNMLRNVGLQTKFKKLYQSWLYKAHDGSISYSTHSKYANACPVIIHYQYYDHHCHFPPRAVSVGGADKEAGRLIIGWNGAAQQGAGDGVAPSESLSPDDSSI